MNHTSISTLNNDLRNNTRKYVGFINNTSRCYEAVSVERGLIAVRRIGVSEGPYYAVKDIPLSNEYLIMERIFTSKDIASRVMASLMTILEAKGESNQRLVFSVTGNHSTDRSYQLMTYCNTSTDLMQANTVLKEALLELATLYPPHVIQHFTVSTPTLLTVRDDLYKLDNSRAVGSVLNAINTTGVPSLITLPKVKLGYLKVTKPHTRSRTDTILLHDEADKPLFAKDSITADAVMYNDKPYVMFQYSCIRDDSTEGGGNRKLIFGFRLIKFLDEVDEPLIKVFT